jgi:hypothetical protein
MMLHWTGRASVVVRVGACHREVVPVSRTTVDAIPLPGRIVTGLPPMWAVDDRAGPLRTGQLPSSSAGGRRGHNAMSSEVRRLRRRSDRGESLMEDRDDGATVMRPLEPAVRPAAADPTWDRLEDQLAWYDSKSRDSQRRYKWLKLLELAVAAVLPVVAAVESPIWVTGGLAAVVVILEGVQHLYQFQEHWITYRSTAEALKHERYLYLAEAGPYAGAGRHRQLAERLEGLISQEHAKWTASHLEGYGRAEEA